MPEQFAARALDKGLGASGVASPEQEPGKSGKSSDQGNCQRQIRQVLTQNFYPSGPLHQFHTEGGKSRLRAADNTVHGERDNLRADHIQQRNHRSKQKAQSEISLRAPQKVQN